MDGENSRIIRLDPPLPCGTGDGQTVCGRPATLGLLDRDPERPGRWVLTPICKVCTAAMAALYDEERVSDGQER